MKNTSFTGFLITVIDCGPICHWLIGDFNLLIFLIGFTDLFVNIIVDTQ
jgi:hypothetical protein